MDLPPELTQALAAYGLENKGIYRELSEIVRPLRLNAGETLIRAGEPCDRIYFLAEGWVKYFHIDPAGEEYLRYFCHAGHFVAVYGALISGQASFYTVRAISPLSLFYFEWPQWRDLARRHPECRQVQETLIGEALIRSEERERSLILDDAMTRYLSLLDEYPGIENHVRQYDIAAWLGITPIALSRLRRQPMPKSAN